jgi:hypothetical protein
MLLRENPTEDDWYQVWRGHPTAVPGFSQRQSSDVYKRLGLNPQVAKWAGKRGFVLIVNRDAPAELQMRIRGDGGIRNSTLVKEWHQREAAEAARQSHAEAVQAELERGKRRRAGMLTDRQGQPAFRGELLAAYGRPSFRG